MTAATGEIGQAHTAVMKSARVLEIWSIEKIVMTLRLSLSVIITMRTNLRGVLEVLITVNTKNFLIFVAQNCTSY